MPDSDDKNSTGRNIAHGGQAVNNFSAENSDRPDGQDEFRDGVIGAGGTADNFGAENSGRDNFRGTEDTGNSDVEFPVVENSGGTEEIQGREFSEENISAEIAGNSDGEIRGGGNFKNSVDGNSGRENSAETRLVEFLAQSGLEPDDVPGWTVESAEIANRRLGRTGLRGRRLTSAGVRIPYTDVDGAEIVDAGVPFARWRIIEPANGAPKYEAAPGSHNHLFIPAHFSRAWEAASTWAGTLFLTEGEKKAVAACKHGMPTVAVAGVQQWADSAARNAEKDDAEAAGNRAPRLTRDTPIMPELADLIERLKRDSDNPLWRIVVIFDADGAPVAKKDTRGGPGGDFDPRFKPTGKDGKQFVLNTDVFWAGQTLGAALRRQTGLEVAVGFVPHAADKRQISHAGTMVWVKRLERQGLDDWLMVANPEIVEGTLQSIAAQAKAVPSPAPIRTPVKVDPDPGASGGAGMPADLDGNGGYKALGYSVDNGAVTSFFWSNSKKSVVSATKTDLKNDSWIFSMAGVGYSQSRWSRDIERNEGQIDTVFDIRLAQAALIDETDKAGPWSLDNLCGAGVWDDGAGGLIINSEDGVYKVDDGQLEPAERFYPGARGMVVFPTVRYGEVYLGVEATHEETAEFVRLMDSGWSTPRRSDGALMAGWLMLQTYNGALSARPNLTVTGETSSGKTALVDFVADLIGPWTYKITDASNLSPAYLRSRLGSSALTIVLDEAEPARVGKHGAGGRIGVSRDFIAEVVRALRSSYSMHRVIGRGAGDGERRRAHVAAGGKGTADGGARDETLCASALICAISPPETDAADRNRMIHIDLRPLTAEQQARGVPEIDEWLGAKLLRRMWSRWPAFKPTLEAVAEQIDSRVSRMRLTLGSPIAALLVALDEPADGQMAKSLIAQVNADRCGDNAVDSYRPDHEAVLDALLALPVDLDSVGGRGGDPLVSVIAEALRHGMGERGRSGQGDKWGVALRNRGMSARLDDDGQAWLFIAKGHPVFAELARGMSFADVFPILRRTPGAIEAGQRGGVDTRVKLDARKGGHAGVWIPVPVDLEPEPETAPDTDDPLA